MSQPDPTMQVDRNGTLVDLTLSGYLPLVEAAEEALRCRVDNSPGGGVCQACRQRLEYALDRVWGVGQ